MLVFTLYLFAYNCIYCIYLHMFVFTDNYKQLQTVKIVTVYTSDFGNYGDIIFSCQILLSSQPAMISQLL